MNLKLEALPACRVAYVRQTGPYGPANVLAMEQLKQWARERQLLTESAILFGIPRDNPETTLPEACRYDACIVIPAEYPLDSSVREGELSGGEYAICTISHTAEAIRQAWGELFPAIRNIGYQVDNKPIMERYTGEMVTNHYCQLCVPVIPITPPVL